MYRFLKEEWPSPFWHLIEWSSKRPLLRIDILYGNPALCALSRESFPGRILLRRRKNHRIHSPCADYKRSDKKPVFLNYFYEGDQVWVRVLHQIKVVVRSLGECSFLSFFFILHLLRAHRQVLLYSIDFIIRLASCAVCGFFSFIIFNWRSVPSGVSSWERSEYPPFSTVL